MGSPILMGTETIFDSNERLLAMVSWVWIWTRFSGIFLSCCIGV